jgi:phospholipid N-methyltransferase
MSSFTAAALEFVRDPSAVGSAFPASSTMVRRVLAPIDWSAVDLMVEFGPGTGRFTFAALKRMKPGATLLAIEPGEAFVDHLRSKGRDARLIVVQDEAQALPDIMRSHGFDKADCILSGLPFSTLAQSDAVAIADISRASLQPEGRFIAYQMRREIERYLRGRFEIMRKGYAVWNIPPCHLYWARPLVSKQPYGTSKEDGDLSA